MRRSAKKSFQNQLTPVLGATVGFTGSKFLNQIPQIGDNKAIGGVVKLAAGMFLGTQKGEMVQSVGMGMAIGGASDLVDTFLPNAGVGYMPDLNPNRVLGHRRSYAPTPKVNMQ